MIITQHFSTVLSDTGERCHRHCDRRWKTACGSESGNTGRSVRCAGNTGVVLHGGAADGAADGASDLGALLPLQQKQKTRTSGRFAERLTCLTLQL